MEFQNVSAKDKRLPSAKKIHTLQMAHVARIVLCGPSNHMPLDYLSVMTEEHRTI